MIRVKRANRVLRIDETELEYYLKNGYVQINDQGEAVNLTRDGYTVEEYEALREENKTLEARIAELTRKAESEKAASKQKSKTDES